MEMSKNSIKNINFAGLLFRQNTKIALTVLVDSSRNNNIPLDVWHNTF